MPKQFYRPGAYDAVQEGCTCTVRDGEPQDNEEWPDWLVSSCPIHDPRSTIPNNRGDTMTDTITAYRESLRSVTTTASSSVEGTAYGPRGYTGIDGASAYEIAVSNGFVGTETEWLASLEGADGQDGLRGSDGADGQSIVITTTTDQAVYDAATPGPLEIVVLHA